MAISHAQDMNKKTKKGEKLVQAGHRITADQYAFLKKVAKEKGTSEAEALRHILHMTMINHV